MRRLCVELILTSFLIITIASWADGIKVRTPMVDGDCGEYTNLGAESVSLSKDVTLKIFQNEDYVWMCYGYPEGSFGTLDLVVKTDSLKDAVNLHASAQLGEWPADNPELVPKSAESDLWWNVKGWTANPVWINGMDTTSPKPQYRFRNAKARELQLSKDRFGSGEWRLTLNIRRVKGNDGEFYDITFPKDGSQYILKVK
jgi:hypothetical protein